MNDGDHPTLIEAAVESVKAKAQARTNITVPVMKQAHRLDLDARVTFVAPTDPGHPTMMLWEPREQAWRIILLPSGSEWVFRSIAKGSTLWKPGDAH